MFALSSNFQYECVARVESNGSRVVFYLPTISDQVERRIYLYQAPGETTELYIQRAFVLLSVGCKDSPPDETSSYIWEQLYLYGRDVARHGRATEFHSDCTPRPSNSGHFDIEVRSTLGGQLPKPIKRAA
jgi:hypothetical protein